MSSNNLVSILMPVKNAVSYLDECIRSILEQTYPHWELIAIDDNSTDHSMEILQKFEAHDSRIAIHPNDGQGIIEALRLAYANSSGPYITRMDADDIMCPDKLEILAQNLSTDENKGIAVGLVEYFSDHALGEGYKRYARWLNHLSIKGLNFSQVYKECVIPSPCWMVHRSTLDRAGAFRHEVYPEDYDLCFRFYELGLNVLPCSHILHKWRDHGERTSRNDPVYFDNRFLDLKIHYFLRQEANDEVAIWGVGKKGKYIAKSLQDRDISFVWITENPKKIGQNIYGKVVESPTRIRSLTDPRIIIAVANPDEQSRLLQHPTLNKMKLGQHLFLFA